MFTRKVLIIILLLAASSCAFAGITVRVPVGWIREDSGSTAVIKSLNSNASVAVAFNSTGGADITDIVERLYIQMGGTDLAQDSDGDYSFNFTSNSGAESIAMISGSDGYYLVISISGFHDDDKIQDDIEKILDSLDYEDD